MGLFTARRRFTPGTYASTATPAQQIAAHANAERDLAGVKAALESVVVALFDDMAHIRLAHHEIHPAPESPTRTAADDCGPNCAAYQPWRDDLLDLIAAVTLARTVVTIDRPIAVPLSQLSRIFYDALIQTRRAHAIAVAAIARYETVARAQGLPPGHKTILLATGDQLHAILRTLDPAR